MFSWFEIPSGIEKDKAINRLYKILTRPIATYVLGIMIQTKADEDA